MDKYDYLYKIVLIGDSGVGKTNLLKQLTGKGFSSETKATIGVEFDSKKFIINNKKIKAQIWDTAGQERYRAITSAYYRGAHGALIIYDITKKESFKNSIKYWLNQVREFSNDELSIILIGNKIDLEDERIISENVGKNSAFENNLQFLETSALDGTNVKKGFEDLIKSVYKKKEVEDYDFKEMIEKSESVEKPVKIRKKKKKSCC